MSSSARPFNLIGHRIFGNEAAPNTMEAVLKAASSQIQGIETDVFLNKDGKLYVIHGDSDFGSVRLRNMRSPESEWENHIIGDCTDEFLQNMCYHKSDGHKILKLSEILPYFKGNGMIINVEIKELDPMVIKALVDEFIAHEMLPQLMMSSFYHYHRKFISDYTSSLDVSDVPFGFLTYSVFEGASDMLLSQTKPGDRITLSNAALRRYIRSFPELFEKTMEKGIKINIWFDGLKTDDIETLEYYQSLIDLGIDSIITNCPTKALAIQKRISTPQLPATEICESKE